MDKKINVVRVVIVSLFFFILLSAFASFKVQAGLPTSGSRLYAPFNVCNFAYPKLFGSNNYSSTPTAGYCCKNWAQEIRDSSGLLECPGTKKVCFGYEEQPGGGTQERKACPIPAGAKDECPNSSYCKRREDASWLPFTTDYIVCYENNMMIDGISNCGVSGADTGGSPKWCDNGTIRNGAPDTVEEDCPDGPEEPPEEPPDDGENPIIVPDPAPVPLTCEDICSGEGTRKTQCCTCMCGTGGCGSEPKGQHVWTEIGCITASQNGVVVSVMRVFFGVITGFAVLRFIQAGFMINTDDPEKIKEGKSIAVSAISALIFGGMIIVILNFIGIKVLDLGKLI